jgi:hypothetical protein
MTQAEEAVSRIKVRPALGFLFLLCAMHLLLAEAVFNSFGFIGITTIMSFDVLLTVTSLHFCSSKIRVFRVCFCGSSTKVILILFIL